MSEYVKIEDKKIRHTMFNYFATGGQTWSKLNNLKISLL